MLPKLLVVLYSIILLAATTGSISPEISSEDYVKAYFVIYKDYLRGGHNFSPEELMDVVDCYLTELNIENCEYKTGEHSGTYLGYTLAKAGYNNCKAGYGCTTKGDTCCALNTNNGKYELYQCK